MKYLITVALFFSALTAAQAVDKRAYQDIPISAIMSETQGEPLNAGDSHIALAWWITYEYWASIFARDPNMTQQAKDEVLKAIKGYSFIGVVQADISMFGAFDFYNEQQVIDHLNLHYKDDQNQTLPVTINKQPNNDIALMVAQIKPIVEAALGNMGSHFHIFVINDQDKQGSRLLNPYENGEFSVHMKKKSGDAMTVKFETPLDSLFVPRICPNGKAAHVSWVYCPWSGEKL
jgi:hypothetical protein